MDGKESKKRNTEQNVDRQLDRYFFSFIHLPFALFVLTIFFVLFFTCMSCVRETSELKRTRFTRICACQKAIFKELAKRKESRKRVDEGAQEGKEDSKGIKKLIFSAPLPLDQLAAFYHSFVRSFSPVCVLWFVRSFVFLRATAAAVIG